MGKRTVKVDPYTKTANGRKTTVGGHTKTVRTPPSEDLRGDPPTPLPRCPSCGEVALTQRANLGGTYVCESCYEEANSNRRGLFDPLLDAIDRHVFHEDPETGAPLDR